MNGNSERKALAAFVCDRRIRTQPQDVGLPITGRRRTPGLRREEVAQLAGVGLTWYTWFEQGRDIEVSAEFLERLCRAFKLSKAERDHLFMLAHNRLPPHTVEPDSEVPRAVKSMIDSLPNPAYVKSARWDVAAWNVAASQMFGDFSNRCPEHRNIVRMVFLEPTMRHLMVNWETDARRVLEKFRIDYVRARGDPSYRALIDELCEGSAEFRTWWPLQGVLGAGDSVKLVRQRNEEIEYEHTVFAVEGTTGLKLVIYTPRESTTR